QQAFGIFVRVRRKIQCLLFLLRYGAYFQPVGFAYHAGFRCSVIEFGAMRLNLSAASVGGHSRSRFSVMLLILIGVNILIWYGAVIVLGVRQSGENIPHRLLPKYMRDR
ncbi:MAG: hypothetical protein IIY78_06730, partial [Clostridia bacterium]|nr:hypothetical protein [Clostridia bacterium]